MEKIHSLFLTSQSPTLFPFPSPKRLRLCDCYSYINVKAELQEIRVCTNRTCCKRGSFLTLETPTDLAPPNIVIKSCGWLDKCGGGPNLTVLPDGVIISHYRTVARATEVMVEAAILYPGQLPTMLRIRLRIRRTSFKCYKLNKNMRMCNPCNACMHVQR